MSCSSENISADRGCLNPCYRFGDLKLQNPENRAFAQMFQKNFAGKILECHLNLLNVIRMGGYLPDRVINLILQYLSNRFLDYLIYGLILIVVFSFKRFLAFGVMFSLLQ